MKQIMKINRFVIKIIRLSIQQYKRQITNSIWRYRNANVIKSGIVKCINLRRLIMIRLQRSNIYYSYDNCNSENSKRHKKNKRKIELEFQQKQIHQKYNSIGNLLSFDWKLKIKIRKVIKLINQFLILQNRYMEQPILFLEQLLKSKSFEEIPEIIKIGMGGIHKLFKIMHNQINETNQLIQNLQSKCDQTYLKISQRPNNKDLQEFIKIIAKYESQQEFNNFSSESSKLTNRHSTGLDRIMIEQVKTITEALIQKKIIHSQQIEMQDRRSLQSSIQRRLEQNIQIKLLKTEVQKLQERIKILNDNKIDYDEFSKRLNLERSEIIQQVQKFLKRSKKQAKTEEKEKILKVEQDLQNIRHSMRKKNNQNSNPIENNIMNNKLEEIKVNLERKIDKRQFIEFRNKLNREVFNKINLEDAQKIVKNFQSEIFQKINELNNERKKFEQGIHKLVKLEMRIQEEVPSDKIKEIRNSINRVQKKISNKMQSQQQELTRQELDKIFRQQTQIKNQLKKMEGQTSKQIKTLYEFFNCNSEQDFSECENKISRFSIRRNIKCQYFSEFARWSSTLNCETKNYQITWEKQDFNSNQENFLWEKKKSQLLIVTPGIYEIKLCVFAPNRPIISVLVNNQAVLKVRQSRNEDIQKNKDLYGVSLFDYLILPSRSKFSIRVEEESKVQAFLCITKL